MLLKFLPGLINYWFVNNLYANYTQYTFINQTPQPVTETITANTIPVPTKIKITSVGHNEWSFINTRQKKLFNMSVWTKFINIRN